MMKALRWEAAPHSTAKQAQIADAGNGRYYVRRIDRKRFEAKHNGVAVDPSKGKFFGSMEEAKAACEEAFVAWACSQPSPTGRAPSSPNMQVVLPRTEEGKRIRDAFLDAFLPPAK